MKLGKNEVDFLGQETRNSTENLKTKYRERISGSREVSWAIQYTGDFAIKIWSILKGYWINILKFAMKGLF